MPRTTRKSPCSNAQMELAEDYKQWLMNDDISWNNQRSYIVRNLIKKYNKGIFDPMKSIKLFIYLVDRQQERFHTPTPCNVRYITAIKMNEEFIENIEEYKNEFE